MMIQYDIKVGISYQKPCVPNTNFVIAHRHNLGYPNDANNAYQYLTMISQWWLMGTNASICEH
jgi:hypothetical protein